MEQLHQYQMPSESNEDQSETVVRSTRGASKHRRDQINLEIQRLRDLLPLNSCVKDRLFQLQVMSMACIFIRKQSYLSYIIQTCEKPLYPPPYSIAIPKEFDTYKALRGFLLMVTADGKLLHISDNASEYLGSSVEEIMCVGDSIFDLVDSRDHTLLQQQLANGPASVFKGAFPQETSFVCRMNLSKTVKRQMNCYKFIMVEGRYIHPAEYYNALSIMTDAHSQINPIFAAFCTPLICPKNAKSLIRGSTQIFDCQHEMNLRFIDSDVIASEYLGFSAQQLADLSLYDLVHPEQLPILAEMHQTLCNEKDGSVVGLIQLRNKDGDWIWLHTVLTIKNTDIGDLQISGYYQYFREEQAEFLLNNPWIYTTKHFSNYRGELQKDADLLTASSPESLTNLHRLTDRSAVMLPLEDRVCASTHYFAHSSDPNNNSDEKQNHNEIDMFLNSPDSNAILSAAKSICLEQLQQLCASEYFGSTLPDLGQDLEDFFRQVEQPSSSESFVKMEPELEPIKGIKREYDEQPETIGHCWQWSHHGGQQSATLQLPPVSSFSSMFSDDSMDNHSIKRHRSSMQFVPQQHLDYPDLSDHNNAWPEHCFQSFALSHNQKRHGSWTGIQTG